MINSFENRYNTKADRFLPKACQPAQLSCHAPPYMCSLFTMCHHRSVICRLMRGCRNQHSPPEPLMSHHASIENHHRTAWAVRSGTNFVESCRGRTSNWEIAPSLCCRSPSSPAAHCCAVPSLAFCVQHRQIGLSYPTSGSAYQTTLSTTHLSSSPIFFSIYTDSLSLSI